MAHPSWTDTSSHPLPLFWGLMALGAAALVAGLARWAVPNEDAAILFRYAVNLAETGRISFNPGGARAEGATDFLYMTAIAGLVRLGAEPFVSALALNFGALLAVLGMADRMFTLSRAELAGLALVHLLLPGAFAAAVGFSVFVFEAVLLAVLWQVREGRPRGVALAMLAACLTRPDAVVFCAPLGLFCLFRHRRDPAWWRAALWYAMLPGIGYFLGRWAYFGLPLPLPFYVKAEVARGVLGLFNAYAVTSAMAAASIALVTLPLIATHWKNGRFPAWLTGSIVLSFLLIPSLFYGTMRLDQNVANRFFHFIPVVALVLLIDKAPPGLLRLTTIAAVGLASVFQTPYRLLALDDPNGRITLGRALAPLGPDVQMATTEAGHLAYHSGARVVDLWGLNTPAFAPRPADGGYLAARRFDLIILPVFTHGGCAALRARQSALFAAGPQHTDGSRDWQVVSASLQSGIDPAVYALYRITFTPQAPPFLIFVNRESPLFQDMAQAVTASGGRSC